MRPHPLLERRSLRLKRRLHPSPRRDRLLNHRLFPFLVQRKQVKATVLSLALLMVTGCSTLSSTLPANQSTQATKPQTSKLNTSFLSQASPKSQRFASDRQNQLDDQGYSDGYGAGYNGSLASPNVGSANFTDPTEKTIYIDAYNRGYAIGKAEQPSTPSPVPTNTVTPARRAELQQKGNQDGGKDAGLNNAANPGSGIAVLGLTDPTEIQIYTDAYNAGYQQRTPTPTTSPGQIAQLRQQGNQDGYADAQSNLPKDASRTSNFQGLITAAEQRTYTNGYNDGYQRYIDEQNSVIGSW